MDTVTDGQKEVIPIGLLQFQWRAVTKVLEPRVTFEGIYYTGIVYLPCVSASAPGRWFCWRIPCRIPHICAVGYLEMTTTEQHMASVTRTGTFGHFT